jgi:tetraacyldisaccharide 4'-kinase
VVIERKHRSSLKTILLRPLASVYGLIGTARAQAYARSMIKTVEAGVPVISVGNITVGGTGKTPIVIDLARRFTSQGRKVAVLSRGYGRKSSASTLVVSAGRGPLESVEDSGDEPYLIAQSVPEACVIVGAVRKISAALAVKEFNCDLILLDDGMQHMQLARELDIVLFDYADDPFKLEVLPAGRLREPISHLGRAKVIVITKIPAAIDETVKARLAALTRELKAIAPQAVLHYVSFVPRAWSQKPGGMTLSLDQMRGKSALALCGIARPESFLANLSWPDVGVQVLDSIALGDHHWFTSADKARVEASFNASGADFIATTEKDLVRLELSSENGARTYALVIAPKWLDERGGSAKAPDFSACLAIRDGVGC